MPVSSGAIVEEPGFSPAFGPTLSRALAPVPTNGMRGDHSRFGNRFNLFPLILLPLAFHSCRIKT